MDGSSYSIKKADIPNVKNDGRRLLDSAEASYTPVIEWGNLGKNVE